MSIFTLITEIDAEIARFQQARAQLAGDPATKVKGASSTHFL
jgi:hypothetical protein